MKSGSGLAKQVAAALAEGDEDLAHDTQIELEHLFFGQGADVRQELLKAGIVAAHAQCMVVYAMTGRDEEDVDRLFARLKRYVNEHDLAAQTVLLDACVDAARHHADADTAQQLREMASRYVPTDRVDASFADAGMAAPTLTS